MEQISIPLLINHLYYDSRGLEACVADYVRPVILGKFIPKLTMLCLYLLCFVVAGGLINYNHNYRGISCTFCKLWDFEAEVDEED